MIHPASILKDKRKRRPAGLLLQSQFRKQFVKDDISKNPLVVVFCVRFALYFFLFHPHHQKDILNANPEKVNGIPHYKHKEVPVMRAAKMKERPSFQLMCQTDVQSIYHMQMPRWLFSDPRYADMSLDAKVAYTFLLNRFQLSRRNGWVNEYGEVFVIFPRKALAKELRICEQRVTAAFKKLVELKLVWEKRCGRGDANQIYLARVTPIEDPNYSCAPFESAESQQDHCGSRTADSEGLAAAEFSADNQEPQNLQVENIKNGALRTPDSAFPEHQKPMPSKKEKREIDPSDIEVSQSVSAQARDGQSDAEKELQNILDSCELYCFNPETALVFENAIERLFYSDSFRVGNATLPQSRVRAKLRRLDGMILRDVENKLHANRDGNVKNSTAYTMAVLFNCIAESESDLMIDPYLNALGVRG